MPEDAIRHERRDFQLRPVLWSAGGVAALVVLAAVALDLAVPRPIPVRQTPQPGETPPLQIDPTADLATLEAAQRAARDRLDWVDQGRGVVRIPVADAMRIIAARGLPERVAAPDCPEAAKAVPRAPQLQCGEASE